MNDFFSSKAPSEFTKTERRIMNYILENPADFIHMSIGEAARRVGTSEPTISRFARHCGYSDFKELKTALLERQEEILPPWNVPTPLRWKGCCGISSSASKKLFHF